MKPSKSICTVCILIAGMLWGSMGLFVRSLGQYGLNSLQIACLRMCVAAVCFAVLMLCRGKQTFQIRWRDIPLFLGLGLGSVLFFTCCYFFAIQNLSLSVAAILLYTAPIWVSVASLFIFHERFTLQKGLALALSFGGCVLVSGVGGTITPLGLLAGLGAGIGYGAYSILAGLALRKYKPLTVSGYAFFIAAIGSLVICRPVQMLRQIAAAPDRGTLILLGVLAGIVTAVLPYLCYTFGLAGISPSAASILATVEPLMATLLGAIVFHERLSLTAALGIVSILCALILLSLQRKNGTT